MKIAMEINQNKIGEEETEKNRGLEALPKKTFRHVLSRMQENALVRNEMGIPTLFHSWQRPWLQAKADASYLLLLHCVASAYNNSHCFCCISLVRLPLLCIAATIIVSCCRQRFHRTGSKWSRNILVTHRPRVSMELFGTVSFGTANRFQMDLLSN